MSDDIVTRLRKKLVMEALGDKATYLTLGDCLDAAHEIERLRAAVKRWRELAHSEHYAWSQCPHNCVCMSNLYRKKMRDE